uniref:Uncharacterized protein LOC102810139 n=1 Tax=Saccoglossus kowalevskii TaxID=10224 RepID=A0ABM0MH52_SACKO|nr:PREDICTED: uncharacterized protein LOC102810139 [Saccoglossus kowalevskii]
MAFSRVLTRRVDVIWALIFLNVIATVFSETNIGHIFKRSITGDDTEHVMDEQVSVEMEFFSTWPNGGTIANSAVYYGGRSGQSTDTTRCESITRVPSDVQRSMGLSSFYQKYTHAYNIPILSSSRVPDAALTRACYVVKFLMADRRDLRQQMYDKYGRVGIMSQNEVTQSIPEHSHLPAYYNQRARGLGGTLHIPISTGAEENVLCYQGDPYSAEDIFLHEFSHGIHKIAAVSADSTFQGRLQRAYNNARSRGLWANTYAMNTVDEYFAEGVQSYFDQNPSYATPGIHNDINTRDELRVYDPTLYSLIAETFPCGNSIVDRCQDQKEPEGDCIDLNQRCEHWASIGECQKNPEYMLQHCKKSCDQCEEEITTLQTLTEEPITPPLPPFSTAGPITPPLPPKPTTEEPLGDCIDLNPNCAYWASIGECQKNPEYMLQSCKKSCDQCEEGITTLQTLTEEPIIPPLPPVSTEEPITPPLTPVPTEEPITPPLTPVPTEEPIIPPLPPVSTEEPITPPLTPVPTAEPISSPLPPVSTAEPITPPLPPTPTTEEPLGM